MDLEKLNYITEEKLPQIETLIIGVVILFGAFVAIDGFFEKFVNLEIRSVFYLSLLSLWIGYWIFNKFRLPRNKKNKVGIVIAMALE